MQAADMFCGAGGTSTGLLMAAKDLGIKIDLVALNHWELAISTHSANHPDVEHFNSDLQNIDPSEVVPGGKLRLLVASPECTHFSRARGGKPMSKQSRASAKYVLRWCKALDIEDVLIENVPDFLDWGPLDPKTMRPVKERKGEYFMRFVRKLEQIGYAVAWRILNAADYGDPTTRKRLFIIARKNQPIAFPEPTHHKNGGDMFGKRPRWRSAREIIDWSIKGESIFNRKKPLAENTVRRIMAGLVKYNGKAFVLGQQSKAQARQVDDPIPTIAAKGAISLIEPFLVEYHNGKNSERRTRSVDEPLPTLDTSNRFGLAEPFIIQMDQGGRTHDVSKPMPTITSADAFALVEPFIITTNWSRTNRSQPRSIDAPVPTVMPQNTIGLVEPFLVEYYGTGQSSSIDEPMKTLTGRDRFGLVEPITFDHNGRRFVLDIRFRMLQPHELARAMSFPEGYQFKGTREKIVKQIGNAVPVNLAKALCKTLLEGTGQKGRKQ
jgi:DNA (cytosine-5)-methyltransferase 1